MAYPLPEECPQCGDVLHVYYWKTLNSWRCEQCGINFDAPNSVNRPNDNLPSPPRPPEAVTNGTDNPAPKQSAPTKSSSSSKWKLSEGGCIILFLVIIVIIAVGQRIYDKLPSDSDLCAGSYNPDCAQYHRGREDAYRPYGR